MAGSQFGKLSGLLHGEVVLAPAGSFLAAEFQGAFEPFDFQLAPVHRLALELVQLRAERVFAHNTDHER